MTTELSGVDLARQALVSARETETETENSATSKNMRPCTPRWWRGPAPLPAVRSWE